MERKVRLWREREVKLRKGRKKKGEDREEDSRVKKDGEIWKERRG